LIFQLEPLAACAVAISAFNFTEIAPEIRMAFNLRMMTLRPGTRYDRHRGQFQAVNFENNVVPVKLMSAGSDNTTRV
jgi:hypothetical protein